jgi:hypothetical protein
MPSSLNNGQLLGYGAGLFLGTWRGVREVSHSGGTAGYRSWLARYPDQGLSIALLCNTSAANTVDLGHRMAEVYLGNTIHSDPAPAVASDPAALASDAGLYVSVRDHTTVTIEQKNGQLLLDGRTPLTAISAKGFTLEGDEGRIEFEANQSGKTVGFRLIFPSESPSTRRRWRQ